jgi:hypothetical protein
MVTAFYSLAVQEQSQTWPEFHQNKWVGLPKRKSASPQELKSSKEST